MFLFIRSLHILSAFWYVSGLAGYGMMRVAAANTGNLDAARLLHAMMRRFERFMLLPGAVSLVIFGLWTAGYEHWPHFAVGAIVLVVLMAPFMAVAGRRGRILDNELAAALQAGEMTPRLRAALRDKTLLVCELIGLVVVLAILYLMLVKPV